MFNCEALFATGNLAEIEFWRFGMKVKVILNPFANQADAGGKAPAVKAISDC